jgi:hypothetical protein
VRNLFAIAAFFFLVELRLPSETYYVLEGSDYLMTPRREEARVFDDYKEALDIVLQMKRGQPITIEFYRD